jgi:hypothetical protein
MSRPKKNVHPEVREKEEAAQDIPVETSIQRTYTDAARLSHTLYSFQMIFGTTVPIWGEGSIEIRVIPAQLIHMSPQHSKVFSRVLVKQIEMYEKEHGTIAIEKSAPGKGKRKK